MWTGDEWSVIVLGSVFVMVVGRVALERWSG